MRLVGYERFGPAAEVLAVRDAPAQRPGPGEVSVELAFSGVNPSDVKARAGARPGVTKPPFPLIVPHSDGSGVISAVGDGVDSTRVGQRVWIWNGQWQRPFGTAATHITLPSEQAVPLPDTASLETGASLGIPGLTAAHVVFGGGAVRGQTILIHGGAGTVGHLAVQLARWGGARVIATARGPGADRCREAGADVVLDYAAPDLAEQIIAATDEHPISRIVDVEFGRNIETNAAVIAPNGTIAAYGSAAQMSPVLPFGPLLFKAVTIDIVLIYLLSPPQRQGAVSALHKALTEQAISCPVQSVFSLADTALAHETVERGGRTGAILVDVTS
ncbi:NADPH:quinone reductase [uncultured Roseobacter sp.]|uniref:NADPH:quinone reductase n=1 Tax=uncultured Roseobacter sp. TaxID=114847 RepID=UPI0026340FD8|nr:NADPH:quinone reductase [uncultured Roseobacter sp.]